MVLVNKNIKNLLHPYSRYFGHHLYELGIYNDNIISLKRNYKTILDRYMHTIYSSGHNAPVLFNNIF